MNTIQVELADRRYPVLVGPGLLDEAGARIAPLLKRPRIAIAADAAVAELHGARLLDSLDRAGIKGDLIPVPPGEGSKSFGELERLMDRLLELRLDRGDAVAAFGGGVVGDLAGLAAALHKRGSPFIQIPTTLLAQVDSSVGGKTGIDTSRGKNLVGAFHQPRLVLADTALLETLPVRELRAGLAEVIKAALLEDAAFFDRLETDLDALLALEPEPLTRAVTRAVEIKAAIVAEDEHETGRRALLNLGHTFAHAFEAEAGYGAGALLHGEAVALGCALAFRFSAAQGLCPDPDARRAEALLARAGLPTRLSDLTRSYAADRLLDRMADDKKAEEGHLTFILARRIGEAFVARGVPRPAVRDFLISEGALP
jgi:3-dehydroquinate synthase